MEVNEHGELKIDSARGSITIPKTDVKKIEVLTLHNACSRQLIVLQFQSDEFCLQLAARDRSCAIVGTFFKPFNTKHLRTQSPWVSSQKSPDLAMFARKREVLAAAQAWARGRQVLRLPEGPWHSHISRI